MPTQLYQHRTRCGAPTATGCTPPRLLNYKLIARSERLCDRLQNLRRGLPRPDPVGLLQDLPVLGPEVQPLPHRGGQLYPGGRQADGHHLLAPPAHAERECQLRGAGRLVLLLAVAGSGGGTGPGQLWHGLRPPAPHSETEFWGCLREYLSREGWRQGERAAPGALGHRLEPRHVLRGVLDHRSQRELDTHPPRAVCCLRRCRCPAAALPLPYLVSVASLGMEPAAVVQSCGRCGGFVFVCVFGSRTAWGRLHLPTGPSQRNAG
jgi:hypothetical protein